MTRKRAKPSVLSPDATSDLSFYWTQTRRTAADIAATLNDDYGLTLTADLVTWHARRRGLAREASPVSTRSPGATADRLWLRVLDRAPVVERVRLVERGTFGGRGRFG